MKFRREGQSREGERVERKGGPTASRYSNQHSRQAFFLYLILSRNAFKGSARNGLYVHLIRLIIKLNW